MGFSIKSKNRSNISVCLLAVLFTLFMQELTYAQNEFVMVGEPERSRAFGELATNFFDLSFNYEAGLWIDTDLSGLEFRSDIGEIEPQDADKDGSYFLSFPDYVNSIEVLKDGFTPFTINFRDLDMELKEGFLEWKITLTSKIKLKLPVQVIADQCNYQLTIDEQSMEVSGNTLQLMLENGRHDLIVKKRGFREEKQSILVSEGSSNEFNYSLEDSIYFKKQLDKSFSEAVSVGSDASDFSGEKDFISPYINVNSPEITYNTPVITSEGTLSIQGILEDDSKISMFRINGEEVELDSTFTFDEQVNLCSGTNRIVMYAEDEFKNGDGISFKVIYRK